MACVRRSYRTLADDKPERLETRTRRQRHTRGFWRYRLATEQVVFSTACRCGVLNVWRHAFVLRRWYGKSGVIRRYKVNNTPPLVRTFDLDKVAQALASRRK